MKANTVDPRVMAAVGHLDALAAEVSSMRRELSPMVDRVAASARIRWEGGAAEAWRDELWGRRRGVLDVDLDLAELISRIATLKQSLLDG